MKNLIEPAKLQELKSKPVSYETILEFLDKEPDVAAGFVCKAVGVPPGNFYAWRLRHVRAEASKKVRESRPASEVTPTGVGKRKYTPAEMVALVRDYEKLDGKKRGSFLRTYGLYHTDLERWKGIADQAAVEAFGKKKRRAGKSEEQFKIEELERELQGQEKVISKLSAIVVVQKKISTILGIPDPT